MGLLAQSDFTETASKLLQEANGRVVEITDGEREIGALVPMRLLRELKELDIRRMREISAEAGVKFAAHAAELGITGDELLERLLIDRDEF